MSLTHRTAILSLCQALHEAGIWLDIDPEGKLRLGPPSLVTRHPHLFVQVREHKAEIVALLQDSLAYGVFGVHNDDPRFEREMCPDCQQPTPIVLAPRRLAVHRLRGSQEVCPGSDRAQQVAADTIMQAFVQDRCLPRRLALLSWYALRGALEAWCLQRSLFLPPRPFVIEWLDRHFDRRSDEANPCWVGLILTLEEWGLEDDPDEPQQPLAFKPRKPILRA